MGGRSGSTTHNDWTRFWAQAQEQAWDSWRTLFAQASPKPESDPNRLWQMWSDGLEQLWQGHAPHLSGTNQEVFNRLLDQGKGFFFLSHQMLRAFEQMQAVAEAGEDWKPVLRKAISQAQEQLRQWSGVSTGQAALWGLPAEMWERLAAALAVTPGRWTEVMKSTGWTPDRRTTGPTEWPGDWPALGATREWQLHLQEGTRSTERCREAWHTYASKLVGVGVLALDYLYERLVEAGEVGKPLTTLRQLYDLWVECAEKAYAEVVITPGFAQSQAGVVNAAVELKRYVQESLERAAGAHNLPTRREMDAAHRAIGEMRHELEEVRAQLAKSVKTPRRGTRK